MNLQERIDLLVKLGNYLQSDDPEWAVIKDNAERQNGWFTQPFIKLAVDGIANNFLAAEPLKAFVASS